MKSLNLSAFPISLLDRLGIVRVSLDCSTQGTLPGKHHALLLNRFSKDRSSSKYLYKILSFLLAPRFQHNVSGKLLENGFFFQLRGSGWGWTTFLGLKNTKGKHCKDNNDEKRMFAF